MLYGIPDRDRPQHPLTGEPVKYARALLAAAFAFGTAVVIQVAAAPAASAQQDTTLCTSCWFVHID